MAHLIAQAGKRQSVKTGTKAVGTKRTADPGTPNLGSYKDLGGLKAHALVTAGVSTEQAAKLMGSLRVISPKEFFETLGISERTFQRRAASKSKSLDANASDRALRLASVIAQATKVLGSRDEAERWLSTPAMGLDQHRPIDLLRSTDGTEMVKTLLTRMDYGVYA